jgi:hypothetical protein
MTSTQSWQSRSLWPENALYNIKACFLCQSKFEEVLLSLKFRSIATNSSISWQNEINWSKNAIVSKALDDKMFLFVIKNKLYFAM